MLSPVELSPSSVAGRVKMVVVPATSRKQVVFRLVDADGAPVDLTKEVTTSPAAEPRFSTGRPVSAGGTTIRLRAVDDYNSTTKFDVVGAIVDGTTDTVEFLLEQEHTSCPGVYLAEVGQFVSSQLVERWNAYVCV